MILMTLTWNEFRSAHKGKDAKEVSTLWAEYKIKSAEAVTHSEYKRILNRLQKFSVRFSKQEVAELEARAEEIAKESRPDNYTCTPTDSWKIWMGPTQACLLINTTRKLAFTCSRGYWRHYYLNALYVDRSLLDKVEQLDSIREGYAKTNRLVRRPPLPGVEIKLPTSAKEYQLR